MPLNQNPETGRKLQRQYGFSRIPELNVAEELVPVVIVDSLPGVFPSEFARPAMGFSQSPAVVGELSFVALIARELDVLIQRVTVFSAGAVPFSFRRAVLGAFTEVDSKEFKNFGLAGKPTTIVAFDSTAAFPGSRFARFQGGLELTEVTFDEPIRLQGTRTGPGIPAATAPRALTVNSDTANTLLEVTFDWVELTTQR